MGTTTMTAERNGTPALSPGDPCPACGRALSRTNFGGTRCYGCNPSRKGTLAEQRERRRQIAAMAEAGESMTAIAKRFGVGRQCISNSVAKYRRESGGAPAIGGPAPPRSASPHAAEFAAMAGVGEALELLSVHARARVLAWAASAFGAAGGGAGQPSGDAD